MNKSDVILDVKNLVKHFPITKGVLIQRQTGAVKAVDDVTFQVFQGETLGLVGESGCGKTTVGRTIMHLYEPTSGEVILNGTNLSKIPREQIRQMRREMQMIFQDPYASLNPRMSVGEIIGEPYVIHNLFTKKEREEKVQELLQMVGLNPSYVNRFPHEFSGGQRQRIGIARSLALRPSLIICDEPISALDVSIQAQIINLLEDLQQSLGLTYLFIAHDLSVVRHISNRIAVMYLGVIMEMTSRDELFKNPLHPYSQALLSAVPVPDPLVEEKRQRIILEGDVPSPVNPPSGCRFRTRCFKAEPICAEQQPEYRRIKEGHYVACHLV